MPQPLRARPQPVRLELGLGRRGVGQPRAAAVGTETDGSIVCPATSVRPGRHQADRRPGQPRRRRSRSRTRQDTAGPMARTRRRRRGPARGARRRRPARPGHRGGRGKRRRTTRRPSMPTACAGARIGVARNMAGFHPDIDSLFDEAIAEMKRRGAEIVDPAEVPRHQGARRPRVRGAALRVQGRPRAPTSRRSARRAPVKSLADLIAFNDANREREMPYFGQEIFAEGAGEGTAHRPRTTRRRSRPAAGSRARKGSTRCSRSTSSTPSSRRPARPPG